MSLLNVKICSKSWHRFENLESQLIIKPVNLISNWNWNVNLISFNIQDSDTASVVLLVLLRGGRGGGGGNLFLSSNPKQRQTELRVNICITLLVGTEKDLGEIPIWLVARNNWHCSPASDRLNAVVEWSWCESDLKCGDNLKNIKFKLNWSSNTCIQSVDVDLLECSRPCEF